MNEVSDTRIRFFSKSNFKDIYYKKMYVLEQVLFPFLVFVMRVWMGRVFWYSGLTKISNWNSTVYLFKYEYNTPIFSPEAAAFLVTTFELACPWLLVLGFATRYAVLPLLSMTAVIQFTYLDSQEHFYWAILLGTILLYGPGRFSIDRLVRNKFERNVWF